MEGEVPLLLPAAAAPLACAWCAGSGRVAWRHGSTEARRECSAVDGTRERLKVSAVDVLRCRQCHGLCGAAVVAATEGQDHAALRCSARELHRSLNRLGARVGEEDAPRPAVEEAAEAVVQPEARFVIDDVLLAMDQLRCLLGDRCCNLRMRVTRVHHADPRGVVEPALAAPVDEPGSFTTLHVDASGATPDRSDHIVAGDWTARCRAHYFRLARRRCMSAPIATSETVTTKKSVAKAFTWGGIPFCTFR